MSDTPIKALKSFVYISGGAPHSIAVNQIVNMDETLAQGFIADGLVEPYTLITPADAISITENGTVDVTQYASATVDVDVLTITYNANGGTGTVAPVYVAAGDSITLSDGTGLTAPEGKEFAGWAKTSGAASPTVESPYTVTASDTLYAVYVDATPAG